MHRQSLIVSRAASNSRDLGRARSIRYLFDHRVNKHFIRRRTRMRGGVDRLKLRR